MQLCTPLWSANEAAVAGLLPRTDSWQPKQLTALPISTTVGSGLNSGEGRVGEQGAQVWASQQRSAPPRVCIERPARSSRCGPPPLKLPQPDVHQQASRAHAA